MKPEGEGSFSFLGLRTNDAREAGRFRAPIAPATGVDFRSNDYLGLRRHPEVIEAAAKALRDYGAGAGASRLLGGDHATVRELEDELTKLKGCAKTAVFPSGYSANVGLLSALAREDDGIWSDELNHASIVDGCRLARGVKHVYPHRDIDSLDKSLSRNRAKFGLALIVTESVFSMDGDLCDLRGLRECAARHDAMLIVDEAHSTGVLPPRGFGVHEYVGLDVGRDVIVGTLSKALGAQGGFVSGPAEVIENLFNFSRAMIFSTAIAPVLAGAALAAVRLISSGRASVANLRANCELAASLLTSIGIPADSASPIFPVVVNTEDRAVAAARALEERGYSVGAVRPPSVPVGGSRLRITISALHTKAEIEGLTQSLSSVLGGAR
ncbi:MAG: 8-amino-7-oxononanoate synthase [Candidatus Brocadiia bacterium]